LAEEASVAKLLDEVIKDKVNTEDTGYDLKCVISLRSSRNFEDTERTEARLLTQELSEPFL
jgi:hypothetical protein